MNTSTVETYMFADDTKLLHQITCEADCEALQRELVNLEQWSSKWKLKFNASKVTVLHFDKKSHRTYNFTLNGSVLTRNSSQTDLGLIVTSDLSWTNHHDYIIARAYKQLGLARHVFGRNCSLCLNKSLYLTLVRSQMTYGSQI